MPENKVKVPDPAAEQAKRADPAKADPQALRKEPRTKGAR